MTAALDKIRAEIDALDADLRARLLRRAELVAQIGAAKAESGTAGAPLRPLREMQQMRALRAWQRAEAPMLSDAGLLAIWREIIGMALAQQGGVSVCASQNAMALARAHFGASLAYEAFSGTLDDLAENGRRLAVLTAAEAVAPPVGVSIFARLPLLGAGDGAASEIEPVFCYGAVADEDSDADAVFLVRRARALPDDDIVYEAADYVLVETANPADDAVWGRYLTLGEAS